MRDLDSPKEGTRREAIGNKKGVRREATGGRGKTFKPFKASPRFEDQGSNTIGVRLGATVREKNRRIRREAALQRSRGVQLF